MNGLSHMSGAVLLVLLSSTAARGAPPAQASRGSDQERPAPLPPGLTTLDPQYGGPVPISSLDPTAAAVKASLKRVGSTYDDLRPVLLKDGWKPVVTGQCRMNVIGDNAEKLCKEHPENKDCHTCDNYPEITSCSADGYCLMQFRNRKSPLILTTTTYGDITMKSEPIVVGWGFDKKVRSE